MECLLRWCEIGDTKCPVCKAPISVIRRDLEFDKLNGCNTFELDKIMPTVKIIFAKDTIAGITLENNYTYMGLGDRAPGVIVSKLTDRDQCAKQGLRKKDIILFINKIPCMDHIQVINIINSAVASNGSISCTLLSNSRI